MMNWDFCKFIAFENRSISIRMKVQMMKTNLLFLLILTTFTLRGQDFNYLKKMERLPFYSVSLSSTETPEGSFYRVNDSLVDFETYERYASAWSNLERCTPCYLQVYDVSDRLLSEGYRHTDCRFGTVKVYYLTGELKAVVRYRAPRFSILLKLFPKRYCSVRHGATQVFDKAGEVIRSETYKKGVLQKKPISDSK
ncbi:hypothetical protein KFE98_10360 [bacterium SCSIO 12741]|nr:hypothetical protein KFE98_10360 [bacterium SCSIO 12741]